MACIFLSGSSLASSICDLPRPQASDSMPSAPMLDTPGGGWEGAPPAYGTHTHYDRVPTAPPQTDTGGPPGGAESVPFVPPPSYQDATGRNYVIP